MKQTPEFVSKYLADTLKSFITNNSWFSRTNGKGELSYFKLVGYKFTSPNSIKVSETKGKNLISVDLEWDYFDYNSPFKFKATENLLISVFNEIEPPSTQ